MVTSWFQYLPGYRSVSTIILAIRWLPIGYHLVSTLILSGIHDDNGKTMVTVWLPYGPSEAGGQTTVWRTSSRWSSTLRGWQSCGSSKTWPVEEFSRNLLRVRKSVGARVSTPTSSRHRKHAATITSVEEICPPSHTEI
ncbi:hypothetical protein TIFTF001_024558 [Ficus carica]|uniref:Uncharacterized protein n=1 Tax=Ficus carica TaxID=3494 RepID=A0AA88AMP7_FICCA|nr:hypothetical protein TIFTF001_024558 [Ficus carica]